MCDESALTGESLPQHRTPPQNRSDVFFRNSGKQHIILAGTKITTLNLANNESEAYAVVAFTGTQTI